MAQVHTTLSGLDNRFQILCELGSGATGSVFHAQDLVLNRTVAIKVLHAGGDPSAIARFQREAQATSKLNHPNLVHILDFGVDSTNKPYLVMEYLPGRDLKSILEAETKLPLARVIAIAIQLCDALSHAHEKGVLHRDIKPSNVIVQTIDGEERVKLVDFGLAKVLGTDQSLTAPGATVGTVYYLSPETISGKETDARSDLYGLACLLFECLKGYPPFQGETAQSTLLKHVNGPVPRLATEAQSFPPHIETIIAKALAKNPNNRFQTASELKQEFEEYLQNSSDVIDDAQEEPIKKKPPIAVYVLILLISIGAIAFGITSHLQNTESAVTSKSSSAHKPRRYPKDSIPYPELSEVDNAKFVNEKAIPVPEDWSEMIKETTTIDVGPRDNEASIISDLSSESAQQVRIKDRMISIALLTAILKESDLKTLEFQNCRGITDESLKAISKSQTIKSLYLRNMNIKDSSLRIIAQTPGLQTLALDGNRTINGSGLQSLANCKTLLRLYIGDTGVTLEKLQWFLNHAHKEFRNIRIADLNLRDEDVRSLNLKGIKTLFLSGNPITIDTINYIVSFPNLQHLHLTNCKNLDESWLVPLRKLQLESLSLSKTRVSSLSGLSKLNKIHVLFLENCPQLKDKALEELSGFQLDKLNLSKTKITDTGLKTLQKVKPNKEKFVEVVINDCPNITKKGLDWIASIPHLKVKKQVHFDD